MEEEVDERFDGVSVHTQADDLCVMCAVQSAPRSHKSLSRSNCTCTL